MTVIYGKITPLNKVASTVGIFDLYFALIALMNSFAKSAFPLGFKLIPSKEYAPPETKFGFKPIPLNTSPEVNEA